MYSASRVLLLIGHLLVVSLFTLGCASDTGEGDSDGGGISGGETGTAELSWTPPTQRVNGDSLGSALAGYRIYYGTRSGFYEQSITVMQPAIAAYTVENLGNRTYYFAVTALSDGGDESVFSNEATKVVSTP